MEQMDRRQFLKGAAALGMGALCGPTVYPGEGRGMARVEGRVMTVAGPVSAETLGVTLPHEHVLVDFIGADRVRRDRYDADTVVAAVLPHLAQGRLANVNIGHAF